MAKNIFSVLANNDTEARQRNKIPVSLVHVLKKCSLIWTKPDEG
jgi:hypothetical protein